MCLGKCTRNLFTHFSKKNHGWSSLYIQSKHEIMQACAFCKKTLKSKLNHMISLLQ